MSTETTTMRDVIIKHSALPFEYGVADCCQFVGQCVEAMRGYNPAKWFDYETEGDANSLIGSYGNLEALVTVKLGTPTEAPKDGDIALFDQPDGSQILGVVDGDSVVLKSERGVVFWPLYDAKTVWRT